MKPLDLGKALAGEPISFKGFKSYFTNEADAQAWVNAMANSRR